VIQHGSLAAMVRGYETLIQQVYRAKTKAVPTLSPAPETRDADFTAPTTSLGAFSSHSST